MKRVVRLTERDLNRIVKRIIKEDQERFELSVIQSQEGKKGTWRVENGSLILNDGSDLEMVVVNA